MTRENIPPQHAPSRITAENLSRCVLQQLPELRPTAAQLHAWNSADGEPLGLHTLFEDAVVPLILREAEDSTSANRTTDALRLLEDMAQSEEALVLDVLVVSVLEPLLAQVSGVARTRLLSAMGPRTVAFAKNCATF